MGCGTRDRRVLERYFFRTGSIRKDTAHRAGVEGRVAIAFTAAHPWTIAHCVWLIFRGQEIDSSAE